MRPYLNSHKDPVRLERYVDKRGAVLIGGTIPNLATNGLIQRPCKTGDEHDRTDQYLHMTLSLPEGKSASKRIWKRIIATAMKALGLDPKMTPWLAKRDTNRNCDHVHVAIRLTDFANRPLAAFRSEEACEKIHKHLCAMLGLEPPPYFDASAGPRLEPISPSRRRQNKLQKSFFDDLQHAFLHKQPEDLDQLNDHLRGRPGGFQGRRALNTYRKMAYLFSSPKGKMFSGILGEAWEPQAMTRRLSFC